MANPEMSYYTSQGYGTFQATQYPTYPGQTQFHPQYAAQSAPATYSMYPAGQLNLPMSPVDPSPAPEISAVSPEIASTVMRRLILSELKETGFDSISAMALQRFEYEVIAFTEKVFKFAHDHANHANRADPVAIDLALAGKSYGLEPKETHKVGQSWKRRQQGNPELATIVLLPPPSRSPSPELLPSDDEDSPTVIPSTLRTLLRDFQLPSLPPKHTYLRTPISPPKKAALPSLEKKLKNASVVQESLKNLLTATEDNPSSEDKLLFDAAVNWETTIHPRKRWRVGV